MGRCLRLLSLIPLWGATPALGCDSADWVMLTVAGSAHKMVRCRTAIIGYGDLHGKSYVLVDGHVVRVKEGIEELARMLQGPTP